MTIAASTPVGLRRHVVWVVVALAAGWCLLLAGAGAALAAPGWSQQSPGVSGDLHGIACTDGYHAWTVGDGGVVARTTDGGATWETEPTGVTAALLGATFANANDGWVTGVGGLVLATTDGGATWATQDAGTTAQLNAVAAVGANDVWAAGAAGVVLRSTDGGATWAAQTSGTGADLADVTFVDAWRGWAVGAGGTIVATTNGGATWAPQTSGTLADLAGVAFADATNGWAVGAQGTILHTTDGGAAWAVQGSATAADLRAVAFANASKGWAAGKGGAIVATTNGGTTWKKQSSGSTADLASAAFGGVRNGWAVGAGGTVLRTISGGLADNAPPNVTVSGLQTSRKTGWRHSAQTVTLKATDAVSGLAAVHYGIDGAPTQVYDGPFSVSDAGSHAVKYWATDRAGNVSPKTTRYVNIDTSKPVCVAHKAVTTRPELQVKLAYRVRDALPTCGRANVTIRVYRGTRVVKTIHVKHVAVNTNLTRRWTADLPAGRYHWVVSVRDIAGNVQSKKGRRSLTVKAWSVVSIGDVQRRLVALRYLPAGAVTGGANYRTSQALTAFQAWNGLTRDGVAGPATRARLGAVARPRPKPQAIDGRFAEIFRAKGVILFVRGTTLVRVVHCSTGRAGLETPAGSFAVYMKSVNWWSTEYDSWMPYASFFTGGCAVHEYPDVPAYPASHGCVRVPAPEAPWAYSFLVMGTPVIVY